MNCLITGGTGFIGSALAQRLCQSYRVVVLTRQKNLQNAGIEYIRDLIEINLDDKFDVVINLAGAAIADKRWSEKQKQEITNSRLQTTDELIELFRKMDHKPKVFISGSAIGFYGVGISDSEHTETASGDDSFASHLCQSWEQAALEAKKLGVRTCLLRTGIVLGKNGGALKKMLLPFKLGLGGKLGSGQQWMPWIHIEDMLGIILHCIDNVMIEGAINCVAPKAVTNVDFTTILGKTLKRSTLIPMPAFVVKLLFGEMGEALLLSGKKVVPEKALKAGYDFKFLHLEKALSDVLT